MSILRFTTTRDTGEQPPISHMKGRSATKGASRHLEGALHWKFSKLYPYSQQTSWRSSAVEIFQTLSIQSANILKEFRCGDFPNFIHTVSKHLEGVPLWRFSKLYPYSQQTSWRSSAVEIFQTLSIQSANILKEFRCGDFPNFIHTVSKHLEGVPLWRFSKLYPYSQQTSWRSSAVEIFQTLSIQSANILKEFRCGDFPNFIHTVSKHLEGVPLWRFSKLYPYSQQTSWRSSAVQIFQTTSMWSTHIFREFYFVDFNKCMFSVNNLGEFCFGDFPNYAYAVSRYFGTVPLWIFSIDYLCFIDWSNPGRNVLLSCLYYKSPWVAAICMSLWCSLTLSGCNLHVIVVFPHPEWL